MKIYISGKISNLPRQEEKANFWHAAKQAEQMHLAEPEIETYIPLGKTPFLGLKIWICYMAADIWKLIRCQKAYFMPNWIESRGARIERRICEWLKIEIIDEYDYGFESDFYIGMRQFHRWNEIRKHFIKLGNIVSNEHTNTNQGQKIRV